ncbi:hypothetical protein EVAR_70027_1 [Eumeta japonica]|uniref:Uncharacterized protein n=1 Tax=Eumeta variegata TaxID=151549 RepID=A0A4C2A438_EUMVA|nr:hypothetical protein EVAR_70027_1 [Eumeta japonica]
MSKLEKKLRPLSFLLVLLEEKLPSERADDRGDLRDECSKTQLLTEKQVMDRANCFRILRSIRRDACRAIAIFAELTLGRMIVRKLKGNRENLKLNSPTFGQSMITRAFEPVQRTVFPSTCKRLRAQNVSTTKRACEPLPVDEPLWHTARAMSPHRFG